MSEFFVIFFVKVEGGKKVTQGDENALKESVLITPVMAIIDASRVSFEVWH